MLRKADIKDLNACSSLFEQSVKTLCAKDYTKDQIRAWIKIDRQQWEEKFKYDEIFVYEKRGKIASFISVKQEQKLLDLLFTCRRKNKISIWKNKTSIKVEILFFYKA